MTNKIIGHRAMPVMAILLFLVLLALSACTPAGRQANPTSSPDVSGLKGNITVSGAFALYPLMVRWADEFRKIHPGVRIDVSAGGAGKGMADALGGMVDIGMVSRDILPAETDKGAFYLPVAIDAVVPIVNSGNPVKDDIITKGITRQQFTDIYITSKITDWKEVFPGAKAYGKTDINVFTRSDSSGAADIWAQYLGGNKQDSLLGIGVYGDPGLAETVKQDPLAIGYNNIGFAYDITSKKPVDGLLVVPIDVNGNGKIDPEESFYASLNDLDKAIAQKAYPWPPARQENLVALKEFKGVTKEFVKWILTDGQRYAPQAGYIPLTAEDTQKALAKLG